MVSFVIIAKDRPTRVAYAHTFCQKHNIDTFDITILERDLTAKPVPQSIGIEEIKRVQKKLFLKPIRSEAKVVVIEEAHLLTPEAQNALLKVLEEPPPHTIIILSTESKEALLPTILSRCQVVQLDEVRIELTDEETKELEAFIQDLPNLTIGERLKYAEQLAKDKENTLAWIEKLIIILRKQTLDDILNTSEKSLRSFAHNDNILFLKSFQTLHTRLKTTNVNPRFAIENTLLSL